MPTNTTRGRGSARTRRQPATVAFAAITAVLVVVSLFARRPTSGPQDPSAPSAGASGRELQDTRGAPSPQGPQEGLAASGSPLGPLASTDHRAIPSTAADAWLVPPATGPRPSAALRGFATGVEQFGLGNYAQALLLVSDPRLETTPLAAYSSYYTALCYLRLSRPAEARAVLNGLRRRPVEGFLKEAAALAEAEAAFAAGDFAGAARLLDELSATPTASPDVVLDRLIQAARAAGDELGARTATVQLYFEHPASPLAAGRELEVAALRGEAKGDLADELFRRELARAEQLFTLRRHADAQEAFGRLRAEASGDDAELVGLRIAQCQYFLGRHRQAIDALDAYTENGSRRAEAGFFAASAWRALGEHEIFVNLVRRLGADFPESTWAIDALDTLATHYILGDDDAAAADVFRRITELVSSGRRFERAAWKYGWWRYRTGDFRTAAAIFERAAASVPRSDYRPAWIYWAGRARDQQDDRMLANARFELVTVDYLNSYYGRLAATILEARGLEPGRLKTALASRAIGEAGHGGASGPSGQAPGTVRTGPVPSQASRKAALPPNADTVRMLLALELFDVAVDELQYLKRNGGSGPVVDATLAWIYGRQGDLRRGITAMKQAYPQYIAAGGEALPADLLRVVFPLEYWDVIRRHAARRGLDPWVVAALVAQESTFLPAVRSPADAWGLMQILPSTGRRLARAEGIRRFSTPMLTNPEINVRLGTRYFADLVRRFNGVHYALASYNAGELRVARWQVERPGLDRDEFIDDIPFPETQNYVKKILGTAEDYRVLYGSGRLTPKPAAARPVGPRATSGPTASSPPASRPKSAGAGKSPKKVASTPAKRGTKKPPARTASPKPAAKSLAS